MTFTNLFGALVFNSIGMTAFWIGKKRSGAKMMIIGIIMMVYPYLMYDNTIALYALADF